MTKTQFEKINPTLDREHEKIFIAIDKVVTTTNKYWTDKTKRHLIMKACGQLYKACEKHWKTEEKLFIKGQKKMPQCHQSVKKDIDKHRKHHIKMLQRIQKIKDESMTKKPLKKILAIKKGTIKHIETEDVPHFHWV